MKAVEWSLWSGSTPVLSSHSVLALYQLMLKLTVGGSVQLYNAAASHNACAEGLWLSAKTSHAVSKSGKKAVSEQTDQQCLSELTLNLS